MRPLATALLAFGLLIAASSADARHASSSGHPRAHTASHRSTNHHTSHSRATPGVARDRHDRIKRSARSRDSFRKSNPCPSTGRTRGRCPGYVIDHVQALKHGGADAPANMQWQTTAAAKAKNNVE